MDLEQPPHPSTLGMALFAAASAACALAPSVGFLIGARVAQGIGAAMTEPAVFALLGALPHRQQPRTRQIHALGFLLAGALAPALSGAITTAMGWRWIFGLDVAVGVVVLAGGWLVPAAASPQAARARTGARGLNLPGLAAGTAGLGCLAVALIEGARLGWGQRRSPSCWPVPRPGWPGSPSPSGAPEPR